MWFPLLISAAFAGDLKTEAESMMNLDFDVDVIQTKLRSPAPRPGPTVVDSAMPQSALPLEPNSKVDQVVVFRDRALITRHREVKVAPGLSSVLFEGLPLSLLSDSLHAQARSGKFKVVGVELVSGVGKVEDTERIQETRKEAEKLADELGRIRDDIEALLAQRTFLRNSLAGGQDRPVPALEQIKGTLAYVGEVEKDIATKLRTEQDKASKIAEKLSPMLVKLDDPLATGNRVRVDIESETAQSVEIGIRYQVYGASWAPNYNARLDPSNDQVTVEYFGVVSQSTGELWEDASLFLSTANPSTAGALPQLSAWTLSGGYYSGGILDNLDSGRGIQLRQDNRELSTVIASDMSATVGGSGAVVFAIPGKRSIRGDGSEQRLPVGSQTFQATLELDTIPKLVPEIYRTASIKYAGDIPLLPGSLSSFVDTDLVGSSSIGAIVPGEKLRISFGNESTIKVERTLVERTQQSAGKRVKYNFHYRIKVKNFGAEDAEVNLVDQIPVAAAEKVDVSLGDTSTPALPRRDDDPQGVMRWKLKVPKGGEQAIDLLFTVVAPKETIGRELEMMY